MKTIQGKMNEFSLRDEMIETPYIFYINSNTSSCETEPTPIKYVVGMCRDEDEHTILSCVCKDIIEETHSKLIYNTILDMYTYESVDEFPYIAFDERTFHCMTFTKGNKVVNVKVEFGPFSVPFPVST